MFQLDCGKRKATEQGIYVVAVALMILAGCSGGGGGSPAPNAASATGVVYPVVSGLNYQTGTISGVVTATGSYTYTPGQSVTFSVGNTVIANVTAEAKVTPLPLDNTLASTNMLRLLASLDTGAVSGVITLQSIPSAPLTRMVDFSAESSVSAALSGLAPTATLVPASSAAVTTTLDAAKASGRQNLGHFGSTYDAIVPGGTNSWSQFCTRLSDPKNAVLHLTAQPNWASGVLAGDVTLTLNDNSVVTVPISGVTAPYASSDPTSLFVIDPIFSAKSKMIFLTAHTATSGSLYCGHSLRDNSQPNSPPVIFTPPPPTGSITTSPVAGGPMCCEVSGGPTLPTIAPQNGVLTVNYAFEESDGSIGNRAGGPPNFETIVHAYDPDGYITAYEFKSSKGTVVNATPNNASVGTPMFTESITLNPDGTFAESVDVTLTVTDDRGAVTTSTWAISKGTPSTSSQLICDTGTLNTMTSCQIAVGLPSGSTCTGIYGPNTPTLSSCTGTHSCTGTAGGGAISIIRRFTGGSTTDLAAAQQWCAGLQPPGTWQ